MLAAAMLLVVGLAAAVQEPAFAQKKPIAPGGNAAIKPASDVQVRRHTTHTVPLIGAKRPTDDASWRCTDSGTIAATDSSSDFCR